MAEPADAYLDSLNAFGMRLGLERIEALCAALGDPQQRFRSIQIVGTNGKSSTTRFCAAALATAGVSVGAYLSPHILGWHERIQVGGSLITPAAFGATLARVQTAAEGLAESPTQFEALTAAAFVVLADADVEWAVIETGLGGRHDATRVVHAPIVGLTNVSLDHTRVLGDTIAAILAEKLALVERDATLVLGVMDDHLAAAATELGRAAGARVERVDGPVDDAALAGYQLENAALALALASHAAAIDDRRAFAAICGAVPPGRLETVSTSPLVVLDGAHNPAAVHALVAELDRVLGSHRPRVAVVAVQDDKPVAEMLAILRPHVDIVIATESGHRGHAAPLSATAIGADVSIADAEAALAEARRRAGADGAVLVTGSLYLLARLR